MIDFPCNCGYGFSVPDDQAGSAMQCPECKRLNDIPYLSELHNLDDGIYRVDSTPQADDTVDRVAEMTQVFTRNHFDADGLPIDIRGPIVDAYNTGPIPVESLGPLDKAPPKYDPITGELVEELEIKPEPVTPVNAIPMARRANLGAPTVIHGIDVPEPLEAFSIPLRLFQPANILVIIFILMAHGLGSALTLMMASPLALLVAPIWMIWHGLILAHYGNVIDETGPTSHGELPTPLRHLGWHEDIWGPFMQMVISFAFCFGPAIIVLTNYASLPAMVNNILAGAIFTVCIIAFPAFLLTMTTSGTIVNTRPDRLLGVITRCGAEYVLSVILWIVAAGFWLVGIAAISESTISTALPPGVSKPLLSRWYVAWAIMALGTYLMHLFCWHLGTLYRKHFLSFPWILQRHEKANRNQAKGFPIQRPPAMDKQAAPMRVHPITRHR